MKNKSLIFIALFFSLVVSACGSGSNTENSSDSTKNTSSAQDTSSLNKLPPPNGQEPNSATPTDTASKSVPDLMHKTKDSTMHYH